MYLAEKVRSASLGIPMEKKFSKMAPIRVHYEKAKLRKALKIPEDKLKLAEAEREKFFAAANTSHENIKLILSDSEWKTLGRPRKSSIVNMTEMV
jgi:hypothetical protein